MNRLTYILILSVLASFSMANYYADDPRDLIQQVVEANGGATALRALKDVSLEYTFRLGETNAEDVSVERYIFDGEVSYAQYTKREAFALPQLPGTYIQFFDGNKTISTIDGSPITEQRPAYVGHAMRKTNYYWLTMMFKLLDPGVNHKLLPERMVDGISYKIVEVTFGENIGEANDKFILYINPTTHRVDQFLFTAVGFGMTDPNLMKVKYEEIDGIYLMTYRKFAPADWAGNVTNDTWNEQLTKSVQFDNGFSLENIQDAF